jgi:hypothetical protein
MYKEVQSLEDGSSQANDSGKGRQADQVAYKLHERVAVKGRGGRESRQAGW